MAQHSNLPNQQQIIEKSNKKPKTGKQRLLHLQLFAAYRQQRGTQPSQLFLKLKQRLRYRQLLITVAPQPFQYAQQSTGNGKQPAL